MYLSISQFLYVLFTNFMYCTVYVGLWYTSQYGSRICNLYLWLLPILLLFCLFTGAVCLASCYLVPIL
jgi:glucose-6-phosphate-specific signal transduction histidine kinase